MSTKNIYTFDDIEYIVKWIGDDDFEICCKNKCVFSKIKNKEACLKCKKLNNLSRREKSYFIKM